MKILERMVTVFGDIAEVAYLLDHPEQLKNDSNFNRVLALGNWFDIVAALASTKTADAEMLVAVGIKGQMLDFLNRSKAASATVPDLSRVIQKDWTRLVSFTDFQW